MGLVDGNCVGKNNFIKVAVIIDFDRSTGPTLLAMGQICSQTEGHVKEKVTGLVATLLPKTTPMPPQSFIKTRKDANNFRLDSILVSMNVTY